MPKGVEHRQDREPLKHEQAMPTSVMPKGVEHSYYLYALTTAGKCPPL